MSKFDYFRTRAAAYRRMAIDAKDDRTAGDMHEIAAIFNCIADTCDEHRSASPLRQRLFSTNTLIRRIFAR
jgi:hypothetical protein